MIINDNTGKLISNVEWNESKRIKIKNAQEVVFKLSNHIGSKKYLIKPGHTYHVFFGTIGHFFGFSIISIDDTTKEEK